MRDHAKNAIENRYQDLEPSAYVFRHTDESKTSFLPRGAEKPNITLLNPSSVDKEEAKKSGRLPGLSVWDHSKTTLLASIAFLPTLPKEKVRAWRFQVKELKALAEKHKIPNISVITDPHEDTAKAGWEGHALIEGLDRPSEQAPGMTKREQKKHILILKKKSFGVFS